LAELFVDTALSDLDKTAAAMETQDAETAARAIHSIKGAAGNLGFMNLYETAKRIEGNARSGQFDAIREPLERLREQIREIAAGMHP